MPGAPAVSQKVGNRRCILIAKMLPVASFLVKSPPIVRDLGLVFGIGGLQRFKQGLIFCNSLGGFFVSVDYNP